MNYDEEDISVAGPALDECKQLLNSLSLMFYVPIFRECTMFVPTSLKNMTRDGG